MILNTAVLIWAYMTVWYRLSIVKNRNDIADIAWGLGFVVITFYNFIYNPTLKLEITLVLVSIWGLRLASHIYNRNKNKKEDYRYENWKTSAYWKVFMTQGFFMWLICWPLIFSEGSLNWFNLIGVLVWVFGFYFEVTADKQLKDFISNPKNKGKIMQLGLWAHSRHPNYFGEVTMWWGIWLLNLGSSWWTITGPLTITFLILKVSGVPLLEKRYKNNVEYENYKKCVSVFVPWITRKF